MADTTPAQHVSIDPATGVGAVRLRVTDGDRALAFWRDAVGLQPLNSAGAGAGLPMGIDGRELVTLIPGARAPVQQGTTGLYHLALVVPSRADLALVIRRLGALRVAQSPTDHVMTKSDYLWDPDGNGIEIYTETPEDGTWSFSDDSFGARDRTGATRSGRDPIDIPELFSHLEPGSPVDVPLPGGTHMGHVHLHVRDLEEAVRFYCDVVGFDLQGVSHRFGMAFVSAGGYHHHLGLNTWAGRGVPPAPREAAGLERFTVEVPDPQALTQVMERLATAGVAVEESEGRQLVRDPSQNVFALISR